MGSEWKDCRLGDCITLLSGGTPSKSKPEFWGKGTPWVSAKDMKSFWLNGAQDCLTPLGAESATRLVEPGTTLMLVRGMTLHNDIPISRVRTISAFNQDVKAVLPKGSLHPSYLPHLLVALKPRLLSIVDAAGHGTGRLGTETMMALPIQLPSGDTQQDIARFADAIEGKIALLRETNATLEAIAQAIFKSWFVDFAPVLAKAEGREPEGVPPEVANLFPSEFEESELGAIPKGWRVVSLKDITSKIGSGATPRGGKEAYVEEGIALVRSQNVYDSEFTWDGLARITDQQAAALSNVELFPGDVLLNITGASILRTCVVDPGVLPARVNQHVAILRAKPEVPSHYIHQHLLRKSTKDYLMGMNAGASREAVTKGHIESVPVVLPPTMILRRFQEITSPGFARVESNTAQVRHLTELRDTLLPRLMSGKLAIPDLSMESE